MEDLYRKRLDREKKRCFIEAGVINSLLVYYFLSGAYYLLMLARGVELQDAPNNLPILLGLLPVGLLAGFAWTRSPHSAGRAFIERTNPFLKNLRPETTTAWYRRPSGLFFILLLALTAVLGWVITDVNLRDLFSKNGLRGAGRIFRAIFSPDFSIMGQVLWLMIETIFIALMATLIALPVAFLASFFCARNLMRHSRLSLTVYYLLRVIANFTRSLEPLVWAIIFAVWLNIGPFAGMMALMVHSIASLIKLYSEQIENIDQGPLEAIEATGANRVQVVWYAVVPQIVLPYLSFTIYRWDINIRMATIIGLVGGGGIGSLLIQVQQLGRWEQVGTIALTIAVVVWLMDYASARIREAIY